MLLESAFHDNGFPLLHSQVHIVGLISAGILGDFFGCLRDNHVGMGRSVQNVAALTGGLLIFGRSGPRFTMQRLWSTLEFVQFFSGRVFLTMKREYCSSSLEC